MADIQLRLSYELFVAFLRKETYRRYFVGWLVVFVVSSTKV